MHPRHQNNIRAGLGWLIIAAIVLRGVIPVGYMPDVSKPSGLLPGIRICGGHAHNPSSDPAHAKPDAPCPFSINAAFSFAGVQGPDFAALIVFCAVLLTAVGFTLSPQRVYGNASSRSPPLFQN